jgi:hypothetical protein
VLAQQPAVGPQEEHRAVEGSSGSLNDPDHEVNRAGAGDPGQAFDGRAGDIDAALVVSPEPFATVWRPGADDRAEVGALGVPGHERFGKHDELGPLGRRLGGQLFNAVEGALAIEAHGSSLDDRSPDGGGPR